MGRRFHSRVDRILGLESERLTRECLRPIPLLDSETMNCEGEVEVELRTHEVVESSPDGYAVDAFLLDPVFGCDVGDSVSGIFADYSS